MAEDDLEVEEKCKKLDDILGQYYANFGRKDVYYEDRDDNKYGKFAIWVDENGYDDETLDSDMNAAPTDCQFLEFDEDFPLALTIFDEEQRKLKIFKIIKECYKTGKVAGTVEAQDLELENIDDNIKEQAQNLYNKQVPQLAEHFYKEEDVLHFVAARLKNNNFPVLPNVVDCFVRDRMDTKISKKEAITAMEWVKNHAKHFKQLRNNKELQKKFAQAIIGYCNRICPLFQFSPINQVDDSVRDITTYVTATTDFIQQLIDQRKALPPFHIDLSVAVKAVKSCNIVEQPNDDEDAKDNDDVDTEQSPHEIGNIIEKLKHENCRYIDKGVNVVDLSKARGAKFLIHFDQFTAALRKSNPNDPNKNNNNDDDDKKEPSTPIRGNINHQTYPHKKRFNVFIDRRNNDNLGDKITFYEPPSVCDSIPDGHVSELFLERSRFCIIPRKKFGDGSHEMEAKAAGGSDDGSDDDKQKKKEDPYNITITAQTPVGGKLITFSFHVEEAHKIKCYMFWNGQTMRFYPQDIVQAFKFVFTKDCFEHFQVPLKVSYKYENPGVYIAKCTITDQQDNEYYNVAQIRIIDADSDKEAPIARIKSDKEIAKINEKITFDASKSTDFDNKQEDNFETYEVDFGDGTKTSIDDYKEAAQIEHEYKKPGIYTVTLKVTEKSGKKKEDTIRISQTVIDPNEKHKYAKLKVNEVDPKENEIKAECEEEITFESLGNENCTKCIWDFGDESGPIGDLDDDLQKIIIRDTQFEAFYKSLNDKKEPEFPLQTVYQ